MIKVASDYYKDLFGWEARPVISLRDDFFSPSEMVTLEENLILEGRFYVEQIKEAIFKSYADGDAALDGLPFPFSRNYGMWSRKI
jgi:hypothetical protein